MFLIFFYIYIYIYMFTLYVILCFLIFIDVIHYKISVFLTKNKRRAVGIIVLTVKFKSVKILSLFFKTHLEKMEMIILFFFSCSIS